MTTFEIDDDERLPRALWGSLVKLRAGYRCESDGPHGGELAAHHINEDDTDNRLANGMCVCSSCHTRIHNTGKTGEVYRSNLSEKQRANWADPEYRARQKAALLRGHARKRQRPPQNGAVSDTADIAVR